MVLQNKLSSLLKRFWPWLIVLAVILFVGFIRFRLLEMPLERDEGEYAYVGQLILQGIPPYELAYNMKLPGTYLAYAIGMAIFGQTISGVHATLIVVNSLTIIFVFLLGRKLFGAVAGLVSCVSFGILSLSPGVFGLAAHANHFVILFAVPATLLLWNAVENNRARTLFFSGLLYGLAFLMKQHGVCFCLCGYFILILQELLNWKSIVWQGAFKRLFVLGAGMLLPFGLTCLFLVRAGVFSQFWFWCFTYARHYAELFPFQEGETILAGHLAVTSYLSIGLWFLCIVGLLLALLNHTLRKQAIFTLSFWCFAFVGTAIGFYFRGHYFILLLPAFAVLTGLATRALEQVFRRIKNRNLAQVIPLILVAALLGWNIAAQREIFFRMPVVAASRAIYPSNPFAELLAVGNYIREHTQTNATIAVLGSEPQIYFYAQRHSATGYIYTYALMENQPYAVTMQHEMISEIESNKPEYLVLVGNRFSWLATSASDLTIFHWFFPYAQKFYEEEGRVNMYSANTNECYVIMYKRKSGAAVESNPGNAIVQDGQSDEAAVHFQEALKNNPDFAGAHLNLGNTYLQNGRIDEAISQYQKALQIKPDYAEAHDNLGTALMNLGRVDEAIVQYQKTLELQPENAMAQNNLGLALFQEGKTDQAIIHYQKALEINRDYAQGCFNLGLALFKLGRVQEAIVSEQRALQLATAQHDASLVDAIQKLEFYQADPSHRNLGQTNINGAVK